MKVYVKPEIRIERFELSKHIAACAFDVTFNNFETCVAIGDAEFNWGGFVLFTETNTSCSTPKDFVEDFCYTNGKEGLNTFNS